MENFTIEMVDLKGQYKKIESQIAESVLEVLQNATYINGSEVESFALELANYLDVKFVIPCANGTDALQIAIMALDLKPGDEVIVPSFTYVATAEVIALLKLIPVIVDVDPLYFNISLENIKCAITPKTKAIVPVHLFGQCADMEGILELAIEHNLYVIEDAAQAIGSIYTFADSSRKYAGTMGDIGTTSFFPSKNLGCYGDGGAIFTNNIELARKIKMIANHGQEKKYHHKIIGVNSRLDTLQAAILSVKIKYLDVYTRHRMNAALIYDKLLGSINEIKIPSRNPNSTHVFHQYTIIIDQYKRDELRKYLLDNGIPTMIYYPIPLNLQEAFLNIGVVPTPVNETDLLCNSVLSLPMHTELTEKEQIYIFNKIQEFLTIL
jgi:UDP-2-acetamido-2-deoxy-ribo-hexuluronate aminotransferase